MEGVIDKVKAEKVELYNISLKHTSDVGWKACDTRSDSMYDPASAVISSEVESQ